MRARRKPQHPPGRPADAAGTGPAVDAGMTRLERLLRLGLTRLHSAPWRTFRVDLVRMPVPIIAIGAGPSLGHLLERLSPAGQGREPQRSVRAHALRPTIVDHLAHGRIVIARLPAGLAAGRRPIGLLLPELIDSVIDLDARPWPPSRSAASNLRRIAEHGLTWRLRTDRAAFDRFYDRSYVPYAHARHGNGAFVRGRSALRQRFAQGGIQEVLQGDEVLAAQLVSFADGQLECVAVGVPGDGMAAREAGAIAATTAFAVELARQRHLARVNLGGSLPLRRDPLLASKIHWGARIAPRPRADHDLLIAWQAWSPIVQAMLDRLAPIVRGRAGLIGLDGADLRPLPGLAACLPIGGAVLPAGPSHVVAAALADLGLPGSD